MSQLNRLIQSLYTNGIIITCSKIMIIVFQRLGLRCSNTLIYRRELFSFSSIPSTKNIFSSFEFKIIQDFNQLVNIKNVPKKIFTIPFKLWFNRNSICIGVFANKQLIAYTWIHKNVYDNIYPAGKIKLNNGEVFIGPFFTVPEYRCRGIFNALTGFTLDYLSYNTDIKFVYTASNLENLATIRVMIKNGFIVVGLIRVKAGRKQLVEFTQENILSQKIIDEKD